jgi:hypothetical protein
MGAVILTSTIDDCRLTIENRMHNICFPTLLPCFLDCLPVEEEIKSVNHQSSIVNRQ